MPFAEATLNNVIAEALEALLCNWRVTAELNHVFRDRPGLRPDLLAAVPGRLPVIIENEYAPAGNVENEARNRLGLVFNHAGQTVSRSIPLVSNSDLRECASMEEARSRLPGTTFRYALWREDGRFPERGYLDGGLRDLAWFILNAGIPTAALDRSIAILEDHVNDAIAILERAVADSEHTLQQISTILRQDFPDTELRQPFGIIATVLINAMVFQQRLAEQIDVRSLAQMEISGFLNQSGVIREWDRILKINYWPIFSLARELLYMVNNPQAANDLVSLVSDCTKELIRQGVAGSEDLSGVVFQKFIVDRQFLATYYTHPTAAHLLAHLAIPAWNDPDRYRDFRMADFACGTGTLIHAAYQRLVILQQMAGGSNPEHDHAHMMEESLNAADIVPSAAQLTASMLSSIYPARTYSSSRVVVPEYGRVSPGPAVDINDVRLGSLELLDRNLQGLMPMYFIREQIEGQVSDTPGDRHLSMPHGSQDVVIMNPPFTRAGSDWDRQGRHVRQYRGLATTPKEQQLMTMRSRRYLRDTCHHGYAGLASAFVAIADQMVAADGTIAFVLPFSCAAGISWQKVRDLIREKYHNLVVVSIAQHTDIERSFSADSQYPDLLVVAKRGEPSGDARFISLHSKPDNVFEGHEIAKSILNHDNPADMAGSITGGTPITLGEHGIGSMISVRHSDLDSWGAVGMRRFELAQIATHLSHGELRLPRWNGSAEVPICTVGAIAGISVNSANIAGDQNAPFTRGEISDNPAYPLLWNHSNRHDRIALEPDYEGRLREGMDERAAAVWGRRSHAHFSRTTRTSQALTACWTKDRTIGGRSWPNVKMASKQAEAAFVLWSNTTPGIILHWYFGNRSQVLLADHTVSSFPKTPTLNPECLSSRQLDLAMDILEEFLDRELQPMNTAAGDPARIELDRRVLIDLLGLPEKIMKNLILVRQWWCDEPQVRGR